MFELLYILGPDGRTPIPCADPDQWRDWFFGSPEQRIVAKTQIGEVEVSTAFIGANTEADFSIKPRLFETLVLGGPHDGVTSKATTWEEAEQQHKLMCERLAPGGPESVG